MANSDGYNQQVGKTSTDACSLTHTEERDGDSAGSTRAFRGAESASRNLRRKRLWKNNQRRRARSQSGSTSSSLMRDTFFIALPLFYSPRREAVIPPITSH